MLIDNCIPQKLFNSFYEKVTDWSFIPWYFAESTAFPENFAIKKQNIPFSGSWQHVVINDGHDNSVLAIQTREIVNHIVKSLGEEITFLHRVRLGLITRTETNVIHDAHVDFIDFRHRTSLLYLNDSDGDTMLYNKYHKENQEFPLKCDTNDIIQKVSPKPNRVFSLDGWQYHSSSSPTISNYRIVMNINYIIK